MRKCIEIFILRKNWNSSKFQEKKYNNIMYFNHVLSFTSHTSSVILFLFFNKFNKEITYVAKVTINHRKM
jgi:hypothetical protein